MLYRETILFVLRFMQNTLCGQMKNFLMFKLVVHIVTTEL